MKTTIRPALRIHHDDGFRFNSDGRLEFEPTYEPPERTDGIKLVCEMCGKEFWEDEWYHEPRIVPICIRCSHPDRRLITGVRFQAWREWNCTQKGTDRLFYKQAGQIAAAIIALEAKC